MPNVQMLIDAKYDFTDVSYIARRLAAQTPRLMEVLNLAEPGLGCPNRKIKSVPHAIRAGVIDYYPVASFETQEEKWKTTIRCL